MKRISIVFFAGWISALSFAADAPLILKPSKDNFGRSNKRNRNNGACETLLISSAANIRSLIAFDLSSVSNEIISAELRFRPHETAQNQVSLIVAPMVYTEQNAAWEEGQGNLGVQGRIARSGESCYAFSVFPDKPWQSANGDLLTGLSDAELWEAPVAALNGQSWQENCWIRIPIRDVSLLEAIRKEKIQMLTFGVWGKTGNGLYFISSNNSQWAPELHIELKEGQKNEAVHGN